MERLTGPSETACPQTVPLSSARSTLHFPLARAPTAASHVAFSVSTTAQLCSLDRWRQQLPAVCFSRTSPQPRFPRALWHVSAWHLLALTMIGRLARVANSLSNQELVDHLSASTKQPCRAASSTRGDSVTANFTNTSDLPNSSPVVMLITGLHALRHTVRYTRIALHEGQFPTLPVFTGLTPQVRSHSLK